jgi:hypothetical protein
MQLNVYEAKSKLSNMVRLVPIKQIGSKSGVIFGGSLAGKIKLKKGFFDATKDDELLGSSK